MAIQNGNVLLCTLPPAPRGGGGGGGEFLSFPAVECVPLRYHRFCLI